MAANLNSAILNLAILDSAILVFPLKLTHTCLDWFPPFAQKNLHSFILTQLDDGSHLEFCHLEFGHLGFSHLSGSSQIRSHLPRLVPTICTKNLHSFILTQLDDGSHLEFYCCWIKKTSPIHSDSTWWWQSSWILPCWIQTPCFLLSDSLRNTLTPLWFWLKLIQSDSNSFILTQLDEGSHLEFGHHGLSHLIFSSQTHSHLPGLVPTICTKKTTLTFPSPPFAQKNTSHIHSDSTWWWQPSWILPCWIKNFTHSYWLNLMMAAILNSAMLDSDTLLSSLRFTQKHSPSILTLPQTNLIWLKLIHSHSTWWWQPSWILPSWIWPSWIQPP